MHLKPLRPLLIYLIVVFVGGALLAPWIYHAVQWSAQSMPGLQGISQNPFHRFVHRTMLILALTGLWPLLRSLGVRRWADIGLTAPKGQWQRLVRGLLLGFGSLALVLGIAWICGARHWQMNHSGRDWLRHLLTAGTAAIVVSVLEEILFRGALLGMLKRYYPWPAALILSSGLYAILHFFQRPASPSPVTWDSGVVLLARMCQGFVDIQALVPGFLCLTWAGVLLGRTFLRTGSLYESIGLHAGWIFWLKFYGFLTIANPAVNPWFWGTGKLVDGWLALIVLLLLGPFCWRGNK